MAARAVAATGGDGEGVVCIAAPAAILALDAHRDIILGPSSAWEHRLNRCQQTLGEHRVSERCVNTGTPRRRLHTNVSRYQMAPRRVLQNIGVRVDRRQKEYSGSD
jgi:hypothetical protein